MNTEPILIGLAPAAVTGLLTAIVNAINAFSPGTVNGDQLAALNALAIAVMVVLGGIGIWWARAHATPTADPSLPAGTSVRLPDGTAGTVVSQ